MNFAEQSNVSDCKLQSNAALVSKELTSLARMSFEEACTATGNHGNNGKQILGFAFTPLSILASAGFSGLLGNAELMNAGAVASANGRRARKVAVDRKPRQAYSLHQLERLEQEFRVIFKK